MSQASLETIKEPPATRWGILKSIGPGLILSAGIVGSGELIATTRLGSQVGFTLLWFIIFSCFIKVFVQVELGRTTLAEGVGSLQALDTLPGPKFGVRWILWLWFCMFLGSLCQMSGMVGAIAELFASREHPWAHRGWAAAAAFVTALLLASGRYGFVEKASTFMVALFTILNLVTVGFLQATEFRVTLGNMGEGLSFHLPDTLVTAFAVFGMTGVGAGELVSYPIWCLEKGYARATGPRDDSARWYERARGWLRVMKYDAWLSMVIYTVATVSFYVMGAAILHRQGRIVDDVNPMKTLSAMYTSVLGGWGLWVFGVGAFIVLYSTLFVATASNGRQGVDFLNLLGWLTIRDAEHRVRWVRISVIAVPVWVLAVYLGFGNPVTLVLIGGILQALMLPFLAGAAVYFHHRRIPEPLRSGRSWGLLLWASFLAMTCVGLFQTWVELSKLFRKLTP